MSMPTPWKFYQDIKRQWHWRYVDTAENKQLESEKQFSTRDQCISDAKSHGYGYGCKFPKGFQLDKGNKD